MSGGMDDSEPDFLGTEIDFEHPMTTDAAKIRADLCAFHAIPEECLLSRVPPVLQVVDDHVLFPFSPHWSGMRWIRVSSYNVLKKVCYKFRKIIRGKVIRIFVMPYLPLLDAYLIHELIENPGRICLSDDMDIATGNDKYEQTLPVPGRSGVLELFDPRVNPDARHALQLNFTVMNYGLLWAKACEHCEFIGATNRAKELINQLEEQKRQVMEDPATALAILSADHLLNLEERTDQTKKDFLLSLHKHNINPHNAIRAMDAELHEELYDPGYDPCYPNARREHEMVESTRVAVNSYMEQLKEHGNDAYDVNEAGWNMLKAEGIYEAEAHRTDAIKQFCNAIETCIKQLVDTVNKIKMFDRRPSLLGVTGRDRTM